MYNKLVAIKLGMWAKAYAPNDCHPWRNPPLPWVSVSDPQCSMVSCKSRVRN